MDGGRKRCMSIVFVFFCVGCIESFPSPFVSDTVVVEVRREGGREGGKEGRRKRKKFGRACWLKKERGGLYVWG